MKLRYLVIGIIALIVLYLSAEYFFSDKKITPNSKPVNPVTTTNSPTLSPNPTTQTNCPKSGITITKPQPNDLVTPTFTVTAVVDNRNLTADCRWGVFEAQAGSMKIVSSSGVVGEGILVTKEDWMTDGPVNYSGGIKMTKNMANQELKLVITEDDPSGQKTPKTLTIPLNGT